MLEHLKENWIRYLASFIFGIVMLLINLGVKNGWTYKMIYCDGCFIAGGLLVCFSVLCIINNLGGFDIFQYMTAKRDAFGKKPTLYDFSEQKKEKRKKYKFAFIPYLIVGLIFVVAAIVLL